MPATAEQIDWVSRVFGVRAIASAGSEATTGGSTAGDGMYGNMRAAWLAARNKVADDVEKLKTTIVGTYADRGLGPKLEASYEQEVAWVLQQLDERVSAALDALSRADSTTQPALLGEAKEAIGDYTIFLSTDKTVQALDDNPFVPLSIRKTLSTTLSALTKALV